MRILHRYILKEMLKAFGLALAASSGVLCFGIVLKALQAQGLGPLSSLLYMGISIPWAAYLGLPLSAVLATTLVYGRLAADNEVMAARASGIPVTSLLWPNVLLALGTAGLSLVLAAWPLPESRYLAKVIAMNDIERFFFTQLKSTGKIKMKKQNFRLTVDRVVGDMLYGPTVQRGSHTRGQLYIYAPYGRVEFDTDRNQARLFLSEASITDETRTFRFEGTHVVDISLPTQLPRKEDDLSLWRLMAVQRYPEFSDRYRDLDDDTEEPVRKVTKKVVRAKAMAEMHGRMSNAVGCLGLVLVGAGLGILFHSGHLLTAFGVAMGPWLASTILTMTAVKTVSRIIDDPQDSLYLIWLPNGLVVLLGLALMAHLAWGWSSPKRLGDLLRRRAP